MKLIPTIVATLSLSVPVLLAACSENEPAVCGSVDNLLVVGRGRPGR